MSQPISLRTCRDAHPRAECAKRTAAIAIAMARMSDKAIGDAAREQIAFGQVASSADVEARFAARRAALRAKSGAADA